MAHTHTHTFPIYKLFLLISYIIKILNFTEEQNKWLNITVKITMAIEWTLNY